MVAPAVAELERAALGIDDAPALLAFEVQNRDWFEKHVGPRPDTYWDFRTLTEIIRDQVDAGEAMFLLKIGGEILGRLNLTGVERGVAQLGYRVGYKFTGQGVATRAVGMAVQTAQNMGLWALEARVLLNNSASKRVLEKADFVRTGSDLIGDLDCETFRRDFDQDQKLPLLTRLHW